MPLYKIISIIIGIEKLAYTLLLKGKTKVPTKEEGIVLFKYRQIEEYTNLIREFFKAKVYTTQNTNISILLINIKGRGY